MPKKIKQAKKCKVCSKILREQNKGGLCSHHYKIKYFREYRKERKEKHLCIMCGKKVEPMILYPAGKTVPPIITYSVRCYNCRKKQTEYYKIYRLKKQAKNKKGGLLPL